MMKLPFPSSFQRKLESSQLIKSGAAGHKRFCLLRRFDIFAGFQLALE
jgi:hypothetical protein